MSIVENFKKRSLDRKIFLIGCAVAFIGFFIPFISFTRKATLDQVLDKITRTEKVKFNETSGDTNQRAFRTITETKVVLPSKGFAKADVEFLSPLSDSVKKDFDPSLPFEKLLTSKIEIVNTDPASATKPEEPKKPAADADEKTMAKYREDFAQYEKDKDAYDEKMQQRENFIRDLEKECKEISSTEGKTKDEMKFNKDLIEYKGAKDSRGSSKVEVKYSIKNIFAAATFFNYADRTQGFAYNSTFLVALWLCTIAGIIVVLLSNGIIMDFVVWFIGAGFGLASVLKLHEYIKYLTDVDVVPFFGYSTVGGYIIVLGWLVALVGIVLSAAHVKQQGIRKEI